MLFALPSRSKVSRSPRYPCVCVQFVWESEAVWGGGVSGLLSRITKTWATHTNIAPVICRHVPLRFLTCGSPGPPPAKKRLPIRVTPLAVVPTTSMVAVISWQRVLKWRPFSQEYSGQKIVLVIRAWTLQKIYYTLCYVMFIINMSVWNLSLDGWGPLPDGWLYCTTSQYFVLVCCVVACGDGIVIIIIIKSAYYCI